MDIRLATEKDLPCLQPLVDLMWEGSTPDAPVPYLESGEAAVYVCEDGGSLTGIAACALRHDYVEGCKGSPVGYLEGIAVLPLYRRQGIAGRLLAACEGFAGRMNCREFAGDCELDNADSYSFHRALGFAEANRIICFTKKL